LTSSGLDWSLLSAQFKPWIESILDVRCSGMLPLATNVLPCRRVETIGHSIVDFRCEHSMLDVALVTIARVIAWR
jgi:hypothetical protein